MLGELLVGIAAGNATIFGGPDLAALASGETLTVLAELGAVLCAPWGQEYMRTHRALRQLATQLDRAGIHVFRFDYFGTGDSSGDSDAGTPLRWIEDIRSAADEPRGASPARGSQGCRFSGSPTSSTRLHHARP